MYERVHENESCEQGRNDMARKAIAIVLAAGWAAGLAGAEDLIRLDKARFLDKCQGAWAGQMIGVCYGDRYEFVSNAKPITTPMHDWKSADIERSLGQDDIYVEMTFLKALEDFGLDISYEQAGKAFADSEYPLWHANRVGRDNVRRGVMPPLSGHPDYNRHADDIDFQIEADLFGIICPGLPWESNRLGGVFGHIMNYGDGVYGGLFVAGMYAAAYLEDHDIMKVIRAGMDCIPKQTEYWRCIADTLRWHQMYPDDWLAAWKKIEARWQDDVDCSPGNPFNIDAKINGAYIVMGLVYGEGDVLKTAQISARCGQDSDCNPSNAVGVLGCMRGLSGFDPVWTSGLPAMEGKKFIFTDYSFKTLIEASQRVAEQVVQRAGGQVEADSYLIPVQKPKPPATLEQWINQAEVLVAPISAWEMQEWDPAWKVTACGHDMEPGVRPAEYGRESVLVLHPVNKETPAAIEADLNVPKGARRLDLEVASDQKGDFRLRVLLNDDVAHEEIIDTKGQWKTISVKLGRHAAETVHVRIENAPNGWSFEAAYLDAISVR
jgi:hypothetical protein